MSSSDFVYSFVGSQSPFFILSCEAKRFHGRHWNSFPYPGIFRCSTTLRISDTVWKRLCLKWLRIPPTNFSHWCAITWNVHHQSVGICRTIAWNPYMLWNRWVRCTSITINAKRPFGSLDRMLSFSLSLWETWPLSIPNGFATFCSFWITCEVQQSYHFPILLLYSFGGCSQFLDQPRRSGYSW